MSKWLKAFLVVALIWVVLGALVVAPFNGFFVNVLPGLIEVADEVRREEVIVKPALGIATLQVQTKNGSISVVGKDTSEITIKAYYTARGRNAEVRVRELQTEVTLQGNKLTVGAVFPYPSGRGASDTIRYEITAPRTLNLNSSTINGGIYSLGVNGVVDITSTNGAVEVLGDAGPKEIVVSTTNGGIVVRTAPQGGRYDLRTVNGSVKVTLPENVGVTLQANTVNGSVSLGYGQWVRQGGQIGRGSVSGTLGDGALLLDINTVNGSIRLDRLETR